MRRRRQRRALWAAGMLVVVMLMCVTCGDELRRIATVSREDRTGDEGCGRLDRCPTFWHEVSDHCPVVVDL